MKENLKKVLSKTGLLEPSRRGRRAAATMYSRIHGLGPESRFRRRIPFCFHRQHLDSSNPGGGSLRAEEIDAGWTQRELDRLQETERSIPARRAELT